MAPRHVATMEAVMTWWWTVVAVALTWAATYVRMRRRFARVRSIDAQVVVDATIEVAAARDRIAALAANVLRLDAELDREHVARVIVGDALCDIIDGGDAKSLAGAALSRARLVSAGPTQTPLMETLRGRATLPCIACGCRRGCPWSLRREADVDAVPCTLCGCRWCGGLTADGAARLAKRIDSDPPGVATMARLHDAGYVVDTDRACDTVGLPRFAKDGAQ